MHGRKNIKIWKYDFTCFVWVSNSVPQTELVVEQNVCVNILACDGGWNRRLERIILCSLIHSYAICIMIRDLYRLLFAGWDYSNQRKEEDDVGGGAVNSSTDTCDILGLCSGVQLRSPFFLVMAPRRSVIGTPKFWDRVVVPSTVFECLNVRFLRLEPPRCSDTSGTHQTLIRRTNTPQSF